MVTGYLVSVTGYLIDGDRYLLGRVLGHRWGPGQGGKDGGKPREEGEGRGLEAEQLLGKDSLWSHLVYTKEKSVFNLFLTYYFLLFSIIFYH